MYKEMIESIKKNIETNIQRMRELDILVVQQKAQHDLLIYLQEQQDKKATEVMGGDYKIYQDGELVEEGTEKWQEGGEDGNEG